MNPSFEQTLVEVWGQALVENAKTVKVGGESYPVRRTAKRGLRPRAHRPGLPVRVLTPTLALLPRAIQTTSQKRRDLSSLRRLGVRDSDD